jgi:hypothetical protein
MRSRSASSNSRDENTLGGSVGAKTEAKVRSSADDLESLINLVKERLRSKAKRGRNSLGSISRNIITVLDPLEMTNIGGYFGRSQIIHTFVETNMKGNLDTIGRRIEPENVLGGVREKTKKDAADGMILQTA